MKLLKAVSKLSQHGIFCIAFLFHLLLYASLFIFFFPKVVLYRASAFFFVCFVSVLVLRNFNKWGDFRDALSFAFLNVFFQSSFTRKRSQEKHKIVWIHNRLLLQKGDTYTLPLQFIDSDGLNHSGEFLKVRWCSTLVSFNANHNLILR